LSVFKKLFQQTFIYGMATVLPRALGIVLVPLYTAQLTTSSFGIYATLMSYLILGNVLLSYGMETAFFRFINKHASKKEIVQSTALSSLTVSTLVFTTALLLIRAPLSSFLNFKVEYIVYAIGVLALDALAVLPFVWLRANERPMKYAIIKIFSVSVNLGFNLFFFLILPKLAHNDSDSLWGTMYSEENKIGYVFISNLIASAISLLVLTPLYLKIGFKFNSLIWKQMIGYAFPVLIAGMAFSVNEAFDKILLAYLLPSDIASSQVGIYAACYKLGVFMTLFATAFRLGIEPFFFNHAKNEKAKDTYATITKYFAIFGSFMMLFVIVYLDIFKRLLIKDSDYWPAVTIVPIILLANLCLGIYHNLSVWYKVTDRTKFGAYISIGGAMVTLILNFVLIPSIGYVGSAIATLAAYGSMMIVSYYFGRRHYPVPYDVKKIIGYMVLSIVFGTLSFYVFDRSIMVGTTLLLVFLLFIYFNEKEDIKRVLTK